jgi:hypothetical protein
MSALTDLKLILGPEEPVITDPDLQSILDANRVRDDDGFYVGDTAYVTTYDMNRAAAKAFRVKAARVAAEYDVSIEGRSLMRSYMYRQLMDMAREYAKRAQPRSFLLESPET